MTAARRFIPGLILLDYPRIGGEDIEGFSIKTIINLVHENIDVHSRRLIAEFPADGIRCIETLLSDCANMTFADNIRHDWIFQ